MKQLNHHLESIAGKVLGPEWRVLRQLLAHWPSIVGADMAAHACPIGVTITRAQTKEKSQDKDSAPETAKLFIRIPGALAPQFQMQEKQILSRVNQMIGYQFIDKIIFEHHLAQ